MKKEAIVMASAVAVGVMTSLLVTITFKLLFS